MQLALQTMTSFSASVQLAHWAEEEDLAGLAVADHYLPGGDSTYALDQLTVLAAVAARTERIALSSLISPVTFRHPAVAWKIGATIDEISAGRFSLGLGAGWMEEEHDRFGFPFPTPAERFRHLEENLAYLSALRAGDETGFQGEIYRLANGPAPEPRAGTLRFIVGGSGPHRTPELAGRYGDEFNVFPSRHAFGPRIERARAAAEAAGRDPDGILISTAFPLVVGADEADLERRIDRISATRGDGSGPDPVPVAAGRYPGRCAGGLPVRARQTRRARHSARLLPGRLRSARRGPPAGGTGEDLTGDV